jgi:hypothetical protein
MSDTDPSTINMQDHDLLIATYTLQRELIRRFDDYIKSNDALHQRTSEELRSFGLNQVKLDGELVTVKGLWNSLDERVDRVENLNKWLSAAALIGAIVATAISLIGKL